MELESISNKIKEEGFAIVEAIYTNDEVNRLLAIIENMDTSKPTFRKTNDLFAIRQFLNEVPDIVPELFNEKLVHIITQLFGEDYFVVKSIYFDKPANSNWFVAYHQDLTISVDRRLDVAGFGPWTVKQNQYAVQPPLDILKDNFTIRIHLDDTDAANGALKIIAGSHLKDIYRPETIDFDKEKEVLCALEKGGIMFMKPLLLHASGRSTHNHKRRVIHIEFSKISLPSGLQWSEYKSIPNKSMNMQSDI